MYASQWRTVGWITSACSAWPTFLIGYHVGHRMPCLAQYETSISIKMSDIQSNFNCFLREAAHTSCCPVQHGSTAEVIGVSCFDIVLHYCRVLRLIEMCLICFLHLVSMDLQVRPVYTFLHSHRSWHRPGTFRPESYLTGLRMFDRRLTLLFL
jgi:hypothetical protein